MGWVSNFKKHISKFFIGFLFYQSERVGKNGVCFKLWKFRSMVKGADKNGSLSVSSTDARVTFIGKILRKTKLDELPNLINILKGDMRLIGPRPEVPYYIDKLSEKERKVILSVRPGCIDIATLLNLNEGKLLSKGMDYDNDIWPRKVKVQYYSILLWKAIKSF